MGLIKKFFVTLLTSIVSASNHTKRVLLSSQKCLTQSALTNLHPNKYNQELHYDSFAVNLDRCAGSCNTLDDLFNEVCVPNETEDLTLHTFNMITVINQSRTLTKHISFKSECKFDSKICNSNQKWNNDKCWCECKNPKEHYMRKKIYFWNLATCSCENGKCARSITDSVVICDEIIDATKTVPTKTIPTKTASTKCTLKTVYISLSFLLIIILYKISITL